jgi:DNA repair photolyase
MAKPGDIFYTNMRGIHAEGVVTENGFLVLKGSEVRDFEAAYLSPRIVKMRRTALADGTIVDWKLTRDVEFKSTSTAAYFLFGANSSGPASWKNADGISMLSLNKVENGVMDDTDSEYTGFFKTVGSNEGSKCHYPTRLDTYGCGCGHDCSYCYAKDIIVNYAAGWDPKNPKYADISRIETKLRKLEPGTVLRLGGLTDCFQPIELQRRVTYETIKLMNKYRVGYLIVTKSHHVADREYLDIMDPTLAHIQITTTTFDDKLAAQYEKASSPSKRVEAIEQLQRLGFDVFFRLSPYIDGWVDFQRLNSVKCDKILVEFLRVNPTIIKRFPVDLADFPVKENSYYHMTLEHKLDVLKRITGFKEVTVCDDNTDHYNYFRDHFNPNPNDCCNLRK